MSKRTILLSVLLALLFLSSCSQFAWRSHAFYADHGPKVMKFSLSAPDKLSVKACPDLSSGSVSLELSGSGGRGVTLFSMSNLTSSCGKDYVEITNSTAGNYTLRIDFSDDAEGKLMFHWAVDSRP